MLALSEFSDAPTQNTKCGVQARGVHLAQELSGLEATSGVQWASLRQQMLAWINH